jgi:hypothetical protein
MTVNHRFLYWGVFLVAAGAVTLVAQGDAVSDDLVAQAARLWPVAVIALGLGLLLRRTRFGLAGGMLAAAMPGLLLGGLIVAVPRMVPDCGIVQPAAFDTRQGTFDGAASVDLALACGDLSVTTVPGTGWQLQAGNASGGIAAVDVSADRLSVTSSSQKRPFGFTRGGDVWRLALPAASWLDLTAEVNAGRGRFDLAGAQLGNVRLAVNAGDDRVDLSGATLAHLSMSVNAASASVRLPTAADFGADLSVSAGSLRICAASELGLRVRATTVLASTHYTGLIRNGDVWESPGYSMANHHADVTITANVGSVDINPAGGCQ